jgi:hypothetical protein
LTLIRIWKALSFSKAVLEGNQRKKILLLLTGAGERFPVVRDLGNFKEDFGNKNPVRLIVERGFFIF